MKLILDCNAADMGNAMNLFFRVVRANPDQKTGTSNAIVEKMGGKDFRVIRNAGGSYTVKGPNAP